MLRTFDEEKENILEIIAKANLQKRGRILDIGTGMGWMATSLAKSGYKVVTIEEKEEFQIGAKELARRFGVEESIEFKIGSVARLSFKKESFDGVVAYLTLHHVTNIEGTMETMIELCKKGGTILIVELTKAGLEMLSKHHTDHNYPLVDLSPILKSKNLDFKVFLGEMTDVYVCQKRGIGLVYNPKRRKLCLT